MQRKKIFDCVVAVLVIAVALALWNRISTVWTVRRLSTRALERIAHDARASTPWVWDMDSGEELELRRSAGLRIVSQEQGRLELETLDEDPYLFLDLGRTNLPSASFPVFHARWTFSQKTPIQLHFWEPGNPEPRASSLIEMPAGTLDFHWDLREVDFERVLPGASASSRWGGNTGRAGRFRVDLGDRPGLSVGIEALSLERPPGTQRWTKTLESLSRSLDRGRGPPPMEASELFLKTLDREERDWMRIVFTPDSRPLEAPERFHPDPGQLLCFGSFAWPYAPSPDTAVKIARGWSGRLRFFEARFPWATPESVLNWTEAWERADTPPFIPRRIRAGDFPGVEPKPRPGKEKKGEDAEPFCWAVFGGALLFFALALSARATGLPNRFRGFGLIEALGVWAALLAVLVTFNRPGSDPRALAVLWGGLGLILVSAARIGERSLDAEDPGTPAGLLRRALKALGLEDWKHRQAIYTALGITAIGFAGLFALGDLFGGLRFKPSNLWQFPDYLLKGFVQQLLLCPFLAARFDSALGGKRYTAAALSAALFSALHMPNFTLTAASLVMGFLWASMYLKHRGLLPLVLSHAVLGTALSSLWVPPLLLSHRVGAMYFLW